MSRAQAIADIEKHFDTGAFRETLARAIAIPTESQNPDRAADLKRYLDDEIQPALAAMGFSCRVLTHPKAKGPFLYAERIEDKKRPTVLGYGHGDVIRGLDAGWQKGLSPWALTEKDGRWYGRGVVDNKGQHIINLTAQATVLKARGKLGFNAKWLIEMGEETGSPGLREVVRDNPDLFKADLLIASDGPRLSAERPIVFLGARGALALDLTVEARAGGHHSGNWGGLLYNPGIILAHAIASIVDEQGKILVAELVPLSIPPSVKRALADCAIDAGPDGPEINEWWGEPGLTTAEKVFGWCNFEVLAFETGNPATPVNAIPPRAWARCQLRFVVGVNPHEVVPAIQKHLDARGLGMVKATLAGDEIFGATRLDPDDDWVRWAC
ncbi:MAG: M20/M25/M40 family metallo-hydrolase, partial [Beijerinckiaceae bacterium]